MKQVNENQTPQWVVTSLPYVNDDDRFSMLTALGTLWLMGIEPQWDALHNTSQRTPLPTYPFEHKRYWIERREPSASIQDSVSKNTEDVAQYKRPNLKTELIAPRNEIEQQLVAIFTRLLRIAPIGVHDNFFDLGGDSMLGVELIALVKEMCT